MVRSWEIPTLICINQRRSTLVSANDNWEYASKLKFALFSQKLIKIFFKIPNFPQNCPKKIGYLRHGMEEKPKIVILQPNGFIRWGSSILCKFYSGVYWAHYIELPSLSSLIWERVRSWAKVLRTNQRKSATKVNCVDSPKLVKRIFQLQRF